MPTGGIVLGMSKLKVPGTEAVPPDKIEVPKVWKYSMSLAVGQVVTIGVILFTFT